MDNIRQFRRLPMKDWRFFFPEKYIPLYAMLLHGGHEQRTSPAYSWHGLRRGSHEFAVWQFTLAGEGALTYEKEQYRLRTGDAMLLHIPHDHCYYLPQNSDHWEFVYIGLNGRDVLRIWRDLAKNTGPVVRLSKDSETCRIALEILGVGNTGIFNNPYNASSYAYQLTMALASDFMPQLHQRDAEPECIKRVVEYCLQHYSEPVSVNSMAEIAGYSRYHFTRLFTQYHGTSPARFLRDLRLRHSVQMLQTDLASVKEIAEKCGFQDVSYFCKVFHSYFGYPPGCFRKSLGGD